MARAGDMAGGVDGPNGSNRSNGSSGPSGSGGAAGGPGGPAGTGRNRGAELGLPPAGPGSVAGLLPRVAAIAVDWLLGLLVAGAFLDALAPFGPLLVYAVVQILLVSTLGYGPGHRLLRLEVQRLDGGLPSLPAVVLRTLLIALVIPAVVLDRDGRGLHDQAAGTVVVRRRASRS